MDDDLEEFRDLIMKLRLYVELELTKGDISIKLTNFSNRIINSHLFIYKKHKTKTICICNNSILKDAYRKLKAIEMLDELRSLIRLELMSQI